MRLSRVAATPAGPGRGDVDEVVAAVGQRLDQVGQSRDPERHPLIEGQLQLGGGRQAAVDAGVGADHLDLEAGHATLADLFDRVGDAVHRADPVGDQRHPRAGLASRLESFAFSAPRKTVEGA